jgi:hypothetical protein
MTVSSTTTKVSYSGNGTTAVFAYTFKIFNASELVVITRVNSTGVETTEALNTAYIVDGVDNASGGNVTFKFNTGNPSDPNYSTTDFRPQTGETVVIKRVLPITQTTDYTPNDPFPAEVHEEALDKLTFINQQQQEEIDRSFKFAETDAGTASIPVASERASKYLGFDTNGDVIAVEGTSSDITVSTYGATLVDDADASAARTTLGLGNLSTLNTVGSSQIDANSVTASELNISGNGSSGQYVTSDGDGSFSYTTPPAFAGRLINIQSFTASGTYTPNASALQALVYVQGAGGGGGGADSDSTTAEAGVASGGNGGGFIQSAFIDVSAGGYTSTITIGSGGAGGAGEAAGTNGGDTVYNDGTISLTAKGGTGGTTDSDNPSPDIARAPDSQANTVSNHTPILNIGTNPAENGVIMESTGGANKGSGGKGGNSFFGYGGRGGKSPTTTDTSVYAGGDAVGFGAGGGGAATRGAVAGSSFPGGDGTGGIIIIYEYT